MHEPLLLVKKYPWEDHRAYREVYRIPDDRIYFECYTKEGKLDYDPYVLLSDLHSFLVEYDDCVELKPEHWMLIVMKGYYDSAEY